MDYLLKMVNSPEDLRKIPVRKLPMLCHEIREKIISAVSDNGGHLASNLGVVELTVALHRVFDVPNDAIVWDVGHQSYAHKILTGRKDDISGLRTKDGISGYPKRSESKYDAFDVGHASTSISAALGIAQSKRLHKRDDHVIAVIGDGALTGGMAYEGLNNAGRYTRNCYKNFIVILNDNKMTISRNVGSMSRYLTSIRTEPSYLQAKGNVEKALDHLPVIGAPMYRVVKKSKKIVKQMLYNTTIFEDMGFAYYGPFDGHDVENLIHVLENAKRMHQPVLLHMVTNKGKGYAFAEERPDTFHGVSKFDVATGEGSAVSGESFSNTFGEHICKLAEENDQICAITAAMQTGTALNEFGIRFPKRFFDVGIAEEHAVCFAGGLAAGGSLPVFAVYSTFLQRGYDQIIHDVAIQNVKVIFAIDRAGIVGEDGETHQGVFDVAFLNTVPNLTVYSPAYYEELRMDLDTAVKECDGAVAVRYPRGKELYKPFDFQITGNSFDCYGDESAEHVIVTYGRIFSNACLALEELKSRGISVRIIKLNRIKPVDKAAVLEAAKAKHLYFFEEGIQQGGLAEHFYFLLHDTEFKGSYHVTAIDNQFVKQATMKEAHQLLKLDKDSMVETIVSECTL